VGGGGKRKGVHIARQNQGWEGGGNDTVTKDKGSRQRTITKGEGDLGINPNMECLGNVLGGQSEND